MTISHYILGSEGEKLAEEYLLRCGYKIVKANYYKNSGQIDIVAKDNETLCFVEVKARADDTDPFEAITSHKRGRLVRMAKLYLQEYHGTLEVDCRFDVVAIEMSIDGKPTFQLLKNAFDAGS